MYSVVSYCPHCGAPIYSQTTWGAVVPPPVHYSCDCRLRLGMNQQIGYKPYPQQPLISSQPSVNTYEVPDWLKDVLSWNHVHPDTPAQPSNTDYREDNQP